VQSYDGDGLRVKKNDNDAQTYYLRSSMLGGLSQGVKTCKDFS